MENQIVNGKENQDIIDTNLFESRHLRIIEQKEGLSQKISLLSHNVSQRNQSNPSLDITKLIMENEKAKKCHEDENI